MSHDVILNEFPKKEVPNDKTRQNFISNYLMKMCLEFFDIFYGFSVKIHCKNLMVLLKTLTKTLEYWRVAK